MGSEFSEQLLAQAREVLPQAVALRRRLHAEPELGLELPETQRAVLEALAETGLEPRTGGRTSAVVATLRGARPGRTLLLRADMDALPVTEETGLEFASRRPGVMHACGHDAHVAMLAGAARVLVRHRERLAGQVKFVFQPGEEGHAGARVLIEEGLLDDDPRVDAAFALHIDPTLPPGRVAGRPGTVLAAADVFSIELAGRGGHASMPHQALDPIPAACELVLGLQSLVTRRVNPFDPVVVSVTQIRAGTTYNVIPPNANLLGTIRSVSERGRRLVHEGVRRVAEGIARAHGVEARVQLLEGYPPTVNDRAFLAAVEGIARELLGDGAYLELAAPIMGAEDFAFVLERVPGAILFLGARPTQGEPAPLHSSRMVLDEDALAFGIALHAAVALRWLEATQ